jgi:hypothetical protein
VFLVKDVSVEHTASIFRVKVPHGGRGSVSPATVSHCRVCYRADVVDNPLLVSEGKTALSMRIT